MVAAYTQAKAAREVIDYGDQIALAARIAAAHPEVGAIERARYQVVLLDEYQDTSHAQLVLLRALFGGGHPVTAVGDPCQSIYGWRGASAGNLRRFAADFPVTRPGGRRGQPGQPRPAPVRMLSTSFRNTEHVLDVAGALQAGAAGGGTAGATAGASTARSRPRQGGLRPAGNGRGRSRLGGGPAGGTAGAGARAGAGRAALARAGPAGPRPSDIAVLCRKRSQFPALRSAIEARGIPVAVVGLGGLLTVPEVADVVATLRVMHDPSASAALARLLTGPRWRIGPRDLVALGRRARDLARDHRGRASGPPASGQRDDPLALAVTDLTAEQGSLVEALDDLGPAAGYSAAGHARFAALAAELRMLRTHVARPLPDLVGEVERVLGLDVEVAAQPWRDPAVARADLDAFADAAAAFADDEEEPTLAAFLAYLTAAEAEEFGLEAGQPSGSRRGHPDHGARAPRVCSGPPWWCPDWLPGTRHGSSLPGRWPAPGGPRIPGCCRSACAAMPVTCRPWPDLSARVAGCVHAGVHCPRTGRGAAAGLRGGDPGRVLGGLYRLLVGGRGLSAGAVGVPERGPGGLRGRGRDGGPVDAAAGGGCHQSALTDPVPLPWPPSPAGPRHAAVAGAAALVERARARLTDRGRAAAPGRRLAGR